MLWGSQRPIQIHLKQEGRVLTRDGSSVSGLSEPGRGSLSKGRSSSSSSPSSGSSPREGNTDRPPTPSSTMPSRLSVRAASSAAFSSWNNKKEMKANTLQSKDQENLHVHNMYVFFYLFKRQNQWRMTEAIYKRGKSGFGTRCRLDSNLKNPHEHHCSIYNHNVYLHSPLSCGFD